MSPGPLASTVAVAKLLILGALSPLVAPAMAAIAARNRRTLAPVIDDFAGAVAALIDGGPGPFSEHRVRRVPSAGRYFVASDLHRGPSDVVDLPRRQRTAGLYLDLVTHYAADGWTLVENGDVEDFWLVGGSAYGVGYEARLLGARLARPLLGTGPEHTVLARHLERIVEDNPELYTLLRDQLLPAGRYLRLAGNHDDPFQRADGVALLARHLPGVEVFDHLILVDDGDRAGGDPDALGHNGAVGVITHGHHADAWNAPGRDGLGKLCTSWACAIYDAPLLEAWPGISPPVETERLVQGLLASRLTAVNRVLGASADLFTTDEVLLQQSFERRWPDGREAPILLLGHTHVPRLDATGPDGRAWPGYVNGGSGVAHDAVTGIEWDGRADPAHPAVRLVLWQRDEGRGLLRRQLVPDEAGTLVPLDAVSVPLDTGQLPFDAVSAPVT